MRVLLFTGKGGVGGRLVADGPVVALVARGARMKLRRAGGEKPALVTQFPAASQVVCPG